MFLALFSLESTAKLAVSISFDFVVDSPLTGGRILPWTSFATEKFQIESHYV